MDEVEAFVERTFRPVAEQKSLELHGRRSQSDVPSPIYTDGQRLQQVLKNLLSNAFKFTEQGGVTLSIRTRRSGAPVREPQRSITAEGGVIAFEVNDTGIGIPKDKQQLIFEAFQQADGTTSRKFGGTGLGLSISREMARLLGGEIRVESTPGQGSTFTLFLPARYVDPEHARDGEQSTSRRATLVGATRPDARGARATARASAAARPTQRARRRVDASRVGAAVRRDARPADAVATDADDDDVPMSTRFSCRSPKAFDDDRDDDRAGRPRRADHRERADLREDPARDGAREGLQGARRARRRRRAYRSRTRSIRTRSRSTSTCRAWTAGRARPAQASSGDAAHPGAHHHRHSRAAAGAQGRRDRVSREAGDEGGARGFVQQDLRRSSTSR